MRTDNQQEQIRRVLAICKDQWRSSGIPEDRLEMMGEELEEDLRYAVENGRTVEEVVGPDVQEFAASWAQEDLQTSSPRDRIMVGVIVVVIFLIVAVSLAVRFVPLLQSWWPWYAAVALSLVAAAVLLFWPGRSR
ncbi:MAG: hypothetical protein WA990_07840 [Rubrobacteraceae bacterium]